MRISLIVAVGARGVIGRDNGLPWHLPADLRRFRELTVGKPVVMGRRTYESIGRPLPKRRNIVVSRTPGYVAEGCEMAPSLRAALEAVASCEEVMVIGGARLYAEALPRADRVYLTEVMGEFDGDTYFPELAVDEWIEVARDERPADADNAFALVFRVLERAEPRPSG
ncbi:MAG: type 3 dihydrofolate reductase [Planctomycetota bacterium]